VRATEKKMVNTWPLERLRDRWRDQVKIHKRKRKEWTTHIQGCLWEDRGGGLKKSNSDGNISV